jgi:hypothetical protein
LAKDHVTAPVVRDRVVDMKGTEKPVPPTPGTSSVGFGFGCRDVASRHRFSPRLATPVRRFLLRRSP